MAAKPDRHTEVERKFDVLESTVSPSFEGLTTVARVERSPSHTLDAVYYDTPGRDLAARRITLRRRTGGTDEGWHLKLPAGKGARTEVRAPLGTADDEVPDELRDMVLAIVRNRPLVPVARITTNRTVDYLYDADGAVIAEFCDDDVTAWAQDGDDEQRWREWEIELAAGHGDDGPALLDRLANRLFDAGAVPAAHGSKLARVLAGTQPETGDADEPGTVELDPVHRAVAEQVEQLLVWDRAVRDDAYDSVHQMRVATRKIRSLLQAAEDAFAVSDEAENAWILDELKALAGVLGVARDAEVLAERYERALDDLPKELVRGPVRERLVDGARRQYAAGLRRSLLAMRSPRYFRLLDALERLVAAEPPVRPAEREPDTKTVAALHKRLRKAAKTAAKAAEDDTNEALHRIRKRAKRLRYTAAAVGADKVSERAKAVQTLLGEHQDSVVSREHLSRQAEAAHAAGEDTFTYGLLYRQEEELARRSRARLDDALKKLDKAVRRV
ncbi:CYTH and CHAD domain-containing protein [Mycolicibacterium pulveris]|uniref:CYTH and CHAD domain-containing protein n=1 Tax=Mycolicibacterium pulveris TaxID=36813 RepID=UPI0013D4E8AF|nr:CYTH and CHAD domain-containing protein [Mycolicibacterium pulveris]MCV6983313.1 CYTH and CHAD domain-containing protein [Mycolicibacterium pulveris]